MKTSYVAARYFGQVLAIDARLAPLDDDERPGRVFAREFLLNACQPGTFVNCHLLGWEDRLAFPQSSPLDSTPGPLLYT